MSRFIESIRIENGIPCLLGLHEQRVVSTFQAFYHRSPSWTLTDLMAKEKMPALGVFKCRIVYDIDPYSIEFEPYTISFIRSLKVVDGGEIDYKHKYADRGQLHMLFDMRNGFDDILITKKDLVTDTSFGNIALMADSGEWHTPSSFLLNGIMRQHLLKTGRIFERSVSISDVSRYRSFRVINALRGWDTTAGKVSDIQ